MKICSGSWIWQWLISTKVAARSGSLICSSNNSDNNQHLKTIHSQTNAKELLHVYGRITKRDLKYSKSMATSDLCLLSKTGNV